MKTTLLILAMFWSLFVQSQEWRTITAADFENPATLNWWGEETNKFKINPSNDWVWMLRTYGNYHITNNGEYFKILSDMHPILSSSIYYNSISFHDDTTFILDRNSGLYSYVNDWSIEYSFVNGTSMHRENDTIWIGAENATNAFKFVNGGLQQLNFSALEIRSKNGVLWYTDGDPYVYRYYSGSIGVGHSSDTSNLLSAPNTFKFKPGTDSLFVATSLGISIANTTYFVDSITPNNTSNMPSASIMEFEFDTNNNIWALFGTDFWNLTHLAFLDRSTGQWSSIYDDSNSPIDFSRPLSLEVDGSDNVWISTYNKLHILEINPPTWLGLEEASVENVVIYPNPTNGEITIQTDMNTEIETIQILDLNGRVVSNHLFATKISIGQESGLYFVQFLSDNRIIGTKKIQIN